MGEDADQIVVVDSIEEGSVASRLDGPPIVPGMVLDAVQYRPVYSLDYDDLMDSIANAPRPLILEFESDQLTGKPHIVSKTISYKIDTREPIGRLLELDTSDDQNGLSAVVVKDWDYASAAMMKLVVHGLVPGVILHSVNKQPVSDLKAGREALKSKARPMILDFEGMSLDPAENLVLRMAPDFMWQAGDDEIAAAKVFRVKKGALGTALNLTVGGVGVQLVTTRGIPVQTYVYSRLEIAVIKGRKLVLKMTNGTSTVLLPSDSEDAKMICKQIAYRQRQILAATQKKTLAALAVLQQQKQQDLSATLAPANLSSLLPHHGAQPTPEPTPQSTAALSSAEDAEAQAVLVTKLELGGTPNDTPVRNWQTCFESVRRNALPKTPMGGRHSHPAFIHRRPICPIRINRIEEECHSLPLPRLMGQMSRPRRKARRARRGRFRPPECGAALAVRGTSRLALRPKRPKPGSSSRQTRCRAYLTSRSRLATRYSARKWSCARCRTTMWMRNRRGGS